jgi:hypothetical protein
MKRSFRKYHRWIAPILCLPMALTAITGMAITVIEDWHWNLGVSEGLLLRLHRGAFLNLQAIYPILNGLGMIGLLVTGMTMSSLFSKRPAS